MEDGRIGSPIYDHEFMQHVNSFFRLDTVFASLLCLFSFDSSISFISFISSHLLLFRHPPLLRLLLLLSLSSSPLFTLLFLSTTSSFLFLLSIIDW